MSKCPSCGNPNATFKRIRTILKDGKKFTHPDDESIYASLKKMEVFEMEWPNGTVDIITKLTNR